jgi:hypothetical protein
MRNRSGMTLCVSLVLGFFLVGPVWSQGPSGGGGKGGGKGGGGTPDDGGQTPGKGGGKDKGGNQSKDKDAGNGASQNSSNGPFESQMLAYGAVDAIAKEFVNAACDKLKDAQGSEVTAQIVLYDPTTFANVPNYAAFATNLSMLKDQYNAILKKLSGGVGPASPILDVASLILQYSAASTTETGSSITISDSAIRMSLAHYFTAIKGTRCADDKVKIQFNYPAIASQVAAMEAARKNTIADLEGLLQLKLSVQEELPKAIAAKRITADDEVAKRIPELNKLYDQFITSLSTPDSNTGVAPIVGILQGRAIFELSGKGKSYIVYEEAIAGGGTQKVKKNLFTNVIWGDLISYSGGSIINLAMVNGATSEVLLANTVRMRTGFTRISKPTDDSSSKEGDNLSSLKP